MMNDADKKRAAEFQELVVEIGWNQSEAGRELGVTSNFINMIMNGKCAPSEALLKHLRLKTDHVKGIGGKPIAEIEDLLKAIPVEHRDNALEAVKGILQPWTKAPSSEDRPKKKAAPNQVSTERLTP